MSHQSVWIENLKQYALYIENVQQNKWKTNGVKTGVNVCDKTVSN